jgi:uncharacterized protein (DUF488 family)
MTTANEDTLTIWTVGHSTLPIEDFVDLLASQRIEVVADVRRFPASRRHPQYNREQLERSLVEAGVRYASFQDLGGRREPRADSTNSAWRNASFRGYADYMETAPFATALNRLVTMPRSARVAVMCAEALWWRCHRSLIADYLTAAGTQVLHIGAGGRVTQHALKAPARLVDGRLAYPGEPTLGL